ncbi:transposase [Sphingobium sp. PNB]|nr:MULTISPECIES: transposase [Sphingobium]MCB4861928.1 transposase [Sphingobium sp. PNB]
MIKHSEEFKQEAVRIALTSGLPRERVASDLVVGKSTLNKWISHYRPSDPVAAPQADLARENERLRLENRETRRFCRENVLRRLWAARNEKHRDAVSSILVELRTAVTF